MCLQRIARLDRNNSPSNPNSCLPAASVGNARISAVGMYGIIIPTSGQYAKIFNEIIFHCSKARPYGLCRMESPPVILYCYNFLKWQSKKYIVRSLTAVKGVLKKPEKTVAVPRLHSSYNNPRWGEFLYEALSCLVVVPVIVSFALVHIKDVWCTSKEVTPI